MRLLAFCSMAAVALTSPGAHADGGPEAEQGRAPVMLVRGSSAEYAPLVNLRPYEMLVEVPLSVRGRVEAIGDFPVDLDPGTGQPTVLRPGTGADIQARVGLRINTRRALAPLNLAAEYEHDLVTGAIGGKPRIEGEGLAGSEGLDQQLRKAFIRASFGHYLHLSGGLMTSHWGMGLLANDGDHGWTPGSALFSDPRSGDRVFRLLLATGPVGRYGIFAAVAHDWVKDDDVMLAGDSARQLVGALALGRDRPHTIGVYGALRRQEAADGDVTEVAALDLHARTALTLPAGLRLTLELEGALILGTTDLAPTTEHPQHDVRQLGVALRAALDHRGRIGGVIDLLYASGDRNLDDGQQTGFKPDPNYEMGLLLYRHVIAGHTGRAPFTAADPALVGVPAEDLDRFPARGSVTNTIAVFPRVWWRPVAGLEIYGGPLLAFVASDLVDPLRSRLAGGVPRNAFGAEAGSYLGTELDLGVRFSVALAGTQLTAGAEGGVLLPGSALRDLQGASMDVVAGGRLVAGCRF